MKSVNLPLAAKKIKRSQDKSWQSSNPIGAAYNKLAEAEGLRKSGKLMQAQSICESLIDKYPDYVGALHTLGLIHIEKQSFWQALSCFVRAAMLNPNDWTILINLANVYLELDAQDMAAHTLEQTMTLKSDDASIPLTLGNIYENQREYELAAECFEKSVALNPTDIRAWHMLGGCLTHLGRVEEAAEALKKAWKLDRSTVHSLAALSQLPASVVDIDVFAAIDRARPKSTKQDDLFPTRVAFATAAALDKQGKHEQAWEHLMEANRGPAQRQEAQHEKYMKRQDAALERAENYTQTKPDHRSLYNTAPISLFVLGPSRSGKTSAEKLMGLLDGVKRGYENRIIEKSVKRTSQLSGILTLDDLVNLTSALDSRFTEIYHEELMRRARGAKVFTNTHPARIHDVGRIASTIPKSRFIFVKRDKDDVALRIFMKHYKSNTNHYAYTIENVYRQISWYYEMIDMWVSKLPEITICLSYEDMVADPAGALARAAELCKLPAPDNTELQLGDDRGCSEPYRDYLRTAQE